MLTRRLLLPVLLSIGLLACEGPEGPQGPVGPRGPEGPQGSSELILIEKTLDGSEYDDEYSSYYVDDRQIDVNTVVEIYVKRFYTNTGDPYYTTFDTWVEIEDAYRVVCQVVKGRIRFFDPGNELENETIVVVVAGG